MPCIVAVASHSIASSGCQASRLDATRALQSIEKKKSFFFFALLVLSSQSIEKKKKLFFLMLAALVLVKHRGLESIASVLRDGCDTSRSTMLDREAPSIEKKNFFFFLREHRKPGPLITSDATASRRNSCHASDARL